MRKSVLLLMFICITFSFAQNTTKKWYISVGTFGVDHTSVRGLFDGYFDVDDWSITPFGKLTIARSISRSFAIDIQGSVGEVDNNRLTEFQNEWMTLATVGLRYKFANGYLLKETSKIDPYLRLGFGYHSLDYDSFEFNDVTDSMGHLLDDGSVANRDMIAATAGVGFNFWINEWFGINIETQYVHAANIQNDYVDFFQHSIGAAFLIGPPYEQEPGVEECIDVDGDTLCGEDDDCPEVAGPVANKGCPWPDTDGDGWLDKDEECDLDPCPDGEETDEYYCVKGCKVMKDIEVVPPPPPPVFEFKDVHFDFDKATMVAGSESKVDEAAEFIKQHPDATFIIEGHTDSMGDDQYNINLAQRRCETVLNALAKRGVDKSRFEIKSYGESKPKCDNETKEGRACNRRVEIRAIK